MMNCKEATRLLSDAQERNLTLNEKMQLRFHTAMCSACRQFGKQMHSLRILSRYYFNNSSQSDVVEKIKS